jgi:FlaA1/EpsC-like NDP-sugar epimerase
LRSWLVDLPRVPKRALLMANDALLLSLAVWLAFSLRWGRMYWPPTWEFWLVLIAAPVLCVALFRIFRMYRIATRFIREVDAMRMALVLFLATLVWAAFAFMIVGTGDPRLVVPRSVAIIYFLIAALFIWGSRQLAAWLLKGAPIPRLEREDRARVVIYGAGPAGVQLLEALRRSGDYEPFGFIEEKSPLIGQNVSGLRVYRRERLPRLIQEDGIKEVLLALPESSRRERQEIFASLSAYPGLTVKTVPSIGDIAAGRVSVTDLRPVALEDLLGRDPVPPDAELLSLAIRDKCVMVTGAGGSIGSELARQILRQGPRRLILFELSEAALYLIETEIAGAIDAGETAQQPEVITVLGSVLDARLLERTIQNNGVQTIYHAAAYKHVPIVEHNPVAGLLNNTFGTATLASIAPRLGVERVALISTDKAVRPTSVMGASKRLAELIFQAHAAEQDSKTVFTMVRFGNVLGSSGSVVPLFLKQIESGGPVTVTDREVTRYFMSISEAAGLVIQASAMARGGEVFVLDMGERVKIDDLARMMIRLTGRTVLDEANPDGDIEIRYVGLRPGEKGYEELCIDERTSGTAHPGINRNNEPFIDKTELDAELAMLEQAMTAGDMEVIRAVLMRTVEGYKPSARLVRSDMSEAWPVVSRTLH